MSLPVSYTESTLGTYMQTVLGPVASDMGWTAGTASYAEAINEVLVLAQATDITTLPVEQVRLLGRVCAWRQACAAAACDYTFSADGSQHVKSQVFSQCSKMLVDAEREAIEAGYLFPVTVQTANYTEAPYQYEDIDDLI